MGEGLDLHTVVKDFGYGLSEGTIESGGVSSIQRVFTSNLIFLIRLNPFLTQEFNDSY